MGQRGYEEEYELFLGYDGDGIRTSHYVLECAGV